MNDAILNEGLDLAMEFGQHWLQPIQERLRLMHPQILQAGLDEYNRQCQAAMKLGHEVVPECWREASSQQAVAMQLFRQRILAACPWVSEANLQGLFSQGCYYAWKDGSLA